MTDERWPNLFLIGAAKAGTTSLHAYLAGHPDIWMSPVKEPHFFSEVRPDRHEYRYIRPVTDRAGYLRLFAAAPAGCRYLGESSTSYLWAPGTAERIAAVSPDARILVLLREPISRAYSHWRMDVRTGVQRRPILEALRVDWEQQRKGWGVSHLYTELGCYAGQLQRWFDVFGRQRVLVLYFEHLAADPDGTVRRALAFLDLPPAAIDTSSVENPHAEPRNAPARAILGSAAIRDLGHIVLPAPARQWLRERVLLRRTRPGPIDPEAAAWLAERYAGERERLRELLGEDPPWPERKVSGTAPGAGPAARPPTSAS